MKIFQTIAPATISNDIIREEDRVVNPIGSQPYVHFKVVKDDKGKLGFWLRNKRTFVPLRKTHRKIIFVNKQ